MANRFPLILNTGAGQIQELAASDNLDLTSSGIVNATSIGATSINVTGVSTLGNTVVGGGTTQLIVTGDARITGILTIGTSSITLDGSNNQVNVGSATTITTSGFRISDSFLHSTGLDLGSGNVTSHNINSTGIITATSFSGNLSGNAATVTTNANLTGHVTSVGNAAVLGSFTSAQLATALTDETGSGANVFATSPTLVTPILGSATGTSLNVSGAVTAITFVGNLTGNINSTGVSTISTHYFSGRSNPLMVNPNGGQYVIHISNSGNDATGDGSSGNPYRSLSKAFSMVPDIVHRQSIYIKILGGTYNANSPTIVNGQLGGGVIYVGQGVIVGADSATTFNCSGHYMQFSNYDVPIQFSNLNFVTDTGINTIFAEYSRRIYMTNTCTWTSNSTYGWSYGGGGLFTDTTVDWRAAVSLTSSASAGLGGVFVFDSCARVNWSANLIKSGTRFGNHGISVTNGTWFTAGGCTISNFNQGIANGRNHYDAETGGHTMLNGVTLSNCNTGILLVNCAVNRAYSITYSSNGTNISSSNSFST